MATRTSQEISDGLDFSLDSRIDYLFLFVAIVGFIIAVITVVGLPMFVFYEIGVVLSVGNPVVFAIGMYVIASLYIARGAN